MKIIHFILLLENEEMYFFADNETYVPINEKDVNYDSISSHIKNKLRIKKSLKIEYLKIYIPIHNWLFESKNILKNLKCQGVINDHSCFLITDQLIQLRLNINRYYIPYKSLKNTDGYDGVIIHLGLSSRF